MCNRCASVGVLRCSHSIQYCCKSTSTSCGVRQPFSQKPLTATVPKVFQIGLCGVVEADLELFCNSWSVGFLGERL